MKYTIETRVEDGQIIHRLHNENRVVLMTRDRKHLIETLDRYHRQLTDNLYAEVKYGR
jgi:hypothetical protein